MVLPVAGAVAEPDALPVVVPVVGEPVVVPLTAAPPVLPAAEPPAPALPPACANAIVLESASAPANAIVVSFMIVSFVEDRTKTHLKRFRFPVTGDK
jgi:hypothetical protein